MSPADDRSGLCGRVFDCLVERGDPDADPALAEHLGSCVICFRTMTELRDAPRLAEALRAELPALPGEGDRFWQALAEQTTTAAAAALRDGEAAVTEAPAVPRPPTRARRWGGLRVRIFSATATLVAAAAAFVLVARRPVPVTRTLRPVAGAAVHASAAKAVALDGTLVDDPTVVNEADVADLDAGALRRLLARLGPQTPALIATASNEVGDSGDVLGDVLGDDEGRVSEELADLDGTELRRLAVSLETGVL